MAIYYIESENGAFLFEDGKRKFMRLRGREAYDYLRSEEGKSKRFMKTGSQENGGGRNTSRCLRPTCADTAKTSGGRSMCRTALRNPA